MSKGEDLFVDIKDVAAKPTERKAAPLNGHAAHQGPPPHNGNGNGHAAPGTSNATRETFYTPPVEEKKQTAAEEKVEEAAQQKTTADEEKAIEASGKTGAFLAAGLIEMVFGLCNTGVYLTTFNAAEKQQILDIEDKEEPMTPEEDSLNRRFLKATDKYNKIKTDKIPLSKKEEEALANAFAEHRRITGKDLNPNLILYSTIARVLVSRGMEVFI